MGKVRKVICFIVAVFLLLAGIREIPAQSGRHVTVAFPKMVENCLYIVNEDGSLGGMMYEYFESLRKCTGWDLEYKVDYMENLYDEFLKGDIDIMGSTYYMEDLEKYADYPVTISGFEADCLAVRVSEQNIKSGDISSFNGKKVAIYDGQNRKEKEKILTKFCKSNGISMKYIYYKDAKAISESLKNKEVDMAFIGSMVRTKNEKEVMRFEDKPYYTVVSKGKPDILRELNSALYTMHVETNQGEKIIEKYFPSSKELENSLTSKEEQYLQQKKILRVAVPQKLLMENKVQGENEYEGFAVDAAQYIADMLNLQLKIVTAESVDGAVKLMQEGKADIVSPIYQESAETIGKGIKFYDYCNIEKFKVMNNTKKNFKTLAMLKDQKNAVEAKKYSKVLTYDTLSECMDAVNSGKADVTYIDVFTAQFYLVKEGYRNLNFEIINGNTGFMGLAVLEDSEKELKTIMAKVHMHADREIISDKMLQNAISQKSDVSVKSFIKEHIVAVATGFVLIIIVILIGAFWIFMSKERQKSLEKSMEEKEKNEKKLSEALYKAKVSEQAKTRFLSNVSHEMRTPLNGIIGMLTLNQKEEDKQKREINLQKAKKSADQLLGIINEVLDMSRIESGKEKLLEQNFSMEDAWDDSVYMIQGQAAGKGVNLQCQKMVSNQKVWGDVTKVKQIFLNIIGNAIKFTPAGGVVLAELFEEKKEDSIRYRFVCKDDGIGMTEEFLSNLFQPFNRSEEADTQQIKGTGLGLSIVKGIVELMNGTIDVSSKEGKGSCFVVCLTFPLSDEEKEKENEKLKKVQSSADVIKGKRALLVEDNELNMEIAEEFLKIVGMQVETAENGEIALEKFQKSQPYYYDIIFMDIQMPVLNGYEASKAIRNLPREDAKSVFIAAMTANVFAEDKKKAEEAGMNEHIPKPIDMQYLTSLLQEWFQEGN